MRAIALAAALAAATGTAEARGGCVMLLSDQLRTGANVISADAQEWEWRRRLESMPDEAAEDVEDLIRLLHEHRAAHSALTDALMRLCAAYPAD